MIKLSIIDIVAIRQHTLFFFLCLAYLLESDIANVDCCCRALISEVKLQSAVCVAVCSHVKYVLIRLLLRGQLHCRIVQITDIALVRSRYSCDHGTRLIRIGVVCHFVLHALSHRQIRLYHLNTVVQVARLCGRDVQCVVRHLACGFARACKKQLPVGFCTRQILHHREVSVDNIVSCLVRISKLHVIIRLLYIGVITVFLVYLYIINDKLCIVAKHCVVIRIPYPASADSQIENHIERLVIRRRISNLVKSFLFRKPVIYRIEQLVIDIESEFARIPLTCKHMEIFAKVFLSFRQCVRALLLCMGFSEMKRSVGCLERTAVNFHHIDLTTLRPLSIIAFICRHHPECGQKSFAAWNLCLYLKPSVLEVMFILCINSS